MTAQTRFASQPQSENDTVARWKNMLGVVLLVSLFAGCSDAGLEPVPPPPPPTVDNLMRITGEVCTEPPDVTPFPVKLLFVIDQSASLQY